MTLDQFYQNMAIPDACLLGKRVYKKQFYEKGQLNATDKKAFVEDIKNIEWRYTLKPSTVNIPRFEDDTHEYLEVAVLQVQLSSETRFNRIGQVMQKAIPYPLLIVFSWNDQMALQVAEKRINRADSDKIVVEAVHHTGWIPLTNPTAWQAAFLNDFCMTNFSYKNMFAFYQDMVDRIIALNCAAQSGEYSVTNKHGHSSKDRLQSLQQIEKYQKEKAELSNKLKNEKNLGKQVELNTRIKQITDRIESLRTQL